MRIVVNSFMQGINDLGEGLQVDIEVVFAPSSRDFGKTSIIKVLICTFYVCNVCQCHFQTFIGLLPKQEVSGLVLMVNDGYNKNQ